MPNPAYTREAPLESSSDSDGVCDYDEDGREDYYERESERMAMAGWWARANEVD